MLNIIELWRYLSRKRKIHYCMVLVLMTFSSLAEMVSIGLVIPFLSVLIEPQLLYQFDLIQPIILLFEVTDSKQLVLPIVIIFIIVVVFSGSVRLSLLYFMTRLSHATGADIGINIYRRTLYQDYSIHIKRNSSEVINGIITKTNLVIGGVVTPTLSFISSLLLTIGIIIALIAININIFLYLLPSFGLVYLGVILYNRKKLKRNGEVISKQSTFMVKSLQEGLGGIRDIIIDGTQNFYCHLYHNSNILLKKASAENSIIAGSPRYVIEVMGIVFIAIFAYILTFEEGGVQAAIPTLGALTLGAQRLLPAMQHLYQSYSSIHSSKASFQDVLFLLNQSLPDHVDKPSSSLISFEKEFSIHNLSFRYSEEEPWVFKNINLKLKKNTSIGIVGTTGSGKSTLINIIMGLLDSSEGHIAVDGVKILNANKRSWQLSIAHVPQNIFLTDGTIEDNIAFGIPKEKIDHSKVKIAAKKANILELVESWSDGFETTVGERGMRVSGGQRQRIGIARALYKNADVLILDEATSSLDNETESSIMKEIGALRGEITIFIVAHRTTTLNDCDQIVNIEEISD